MISSTSQRISTRNTKQAKKQYKLIKKNMLFLLRLVFKINSIYKDSNVENLPVAKIEAVHTIYYNLNIVNFIIIYF